MKVLKVCREDDIITFTKKWIQRIENFPRGSPEPAKRLLLLVSSPLLFVYLASCIAERRELSRGEAGLNAVHSGKPSSLVH